MKGEREAGLKRVGRAGEERDNGHGGKTRGRRRRLNGGRGEGAAD